MTQRNLFDPAVRENPYPFFAACREAAAVVQVEPLSAWLVTRYDEVVEVLRNPEVYSSEAMRGAMMQGRTEEFEGDGPPAMVITTDPPKHDRLRELVNRGFTPRRIGELEPRIRAIADAILADCDAREGIDFVRDFAVPFPVRVIAELLGVEPDRFEDFKRWSQAVVATFGSLPTPEQVAASEACFDEMDEYLSGLAEQRRRAPADDLISVLVSKEDADVLTDHEMIGFVILLLIAGNETTTNLLGNTILALHDCSDTLERVRENAALVPALVEEALRWSSPVQLLFRQTREETTLGGVQIPSGAIVLPCYAAANRDPRRFADPDRFDIDRNTQGHLAFGLGIHFCLGAGLARLEARVALEAWTQRLPLWKRVDEQVAWTPSPFLRGPAALPLTRSLSSAAAAPRPTVA